MIRLLVIAGPTAVGKTETAILVAKALDGEIVSADSRQIYRGLEIGTGSPSSDELAAVPHHLISFLDPTERIAAGDFARIARNAIVEIAGRGKQPILAGGSGLYIRAVIDGLAGTPTADLGIRQQIQDEIERRGIGEMIAELAQVDPEYAAIIGTKDQKRLVRALEVWRVTGKPFSVWHREQVRDNWCSSVMFYLDRPRPELRQLIRDRIGRMIEAGWVEEIRKHLTQDGLPAGAAEVVGYRPLAAAISGVLTLDEAIEKTVVATQQFAKRQMTWFKNDPRYSGLSGSGVCATREWAEDIIGRFKAGSI